MSAKVIKGLKYTKDHEWVKVEGNKAYIGITDYAQASLGAIVYVEASRCRIQNLNRKMVLVLLNRLKQHLMYLYLYPEKF